LIHYPFIKRSARCGCYVVIYYNAQSEEKKKGNHVNMATGQFHITLPARLVEKIDIAANEAILTRSEFIKFAVIEHFHSIERKHAELTAIAQGNDILTEAELFTLLTMKRNQRSHRIWKRELRMLMRDPSWHPDD
jgi:hypothetical protein